MSAVREAGWTSDATVADLLIIDGMDPQMRGAVERYVNARVVKVTNAICNELHLMGMSFESYVDRIIEWARPQ